MKFLVWGAGAIGGTVGAYLVRAGHDVTFVDRAADHVEAIDRSGLQITGPVDEFTVQARAFTPETLEGVYEHILLCVKAQDTESAAHALKPHLAPDGYVVSLQNGMNELTIGEVVGKERVIGAFINFGADYLSPGIIHRGNRAAVVLGEMDGQITSRLETLHQAMLDFDDRAIVTTNIWGYLWGKMAYGVMLFATAVTNDSIADALANPEYRQVYIALAREMLAAAAARGVTPEGFNGFDPLAFMPGASDNAAEQSLDQLVTFNRGSAKSHSGIWRDLAVRKRRTEVDAQLGTTVRLGAEVGVAMPLTSRLIDIIHNLENNTRAHSSENLDILKAELA